jgi:asparagine synthetase B (glutamine-hydrolysing)
MKEIIKKYIESLEQDEYALFLSGGMDSILLLICLLEMKKKVHAYSFTRSDIISNDFLRAKELAAHYNIPFDGIFLNMNSRDGDDLISDIRTLKYVYNAKKKTEIECSYPFYKSVPFIDESYILSGHGADGHYCISKKGMLHWRDKIDEFRTNYFSAPNCAQRLTLKQIFRTSGKVISFPYMTDEMIEFFKGKSWDECNRPRQKIFTREAIGSTPLPFKLDNHTNLQLGDSKIAEGFNILLEGTEFKSPISIYNRL